ncbi:hypothetical protein F3157_21395 [Virgibacillus dakarensis]|uniref:Hemerythrin-like domain-containing protein n=1 Tax=Lentibacillus populi TaxID=1827502 RepID=A0A9W5U1J9_9BACI|nr:MULTISPECIES: hypothetical protein [Bacillaceae]MTW88150.1 hypothetical protein [Virgibacillus dakarensis]GGB60647.1 hypothetical protein GCM10011409_42490 [Lentibacillus populi]
MATGPSLRKLESHHSIHEGALVEARDLTLLVERLARDEKVNDCLKAAKTLVEHWETRVIAHADAEEDGFYQEILEGNPKMAKEIHMLTRDHDLIRMITATIKKQLAERKVTKEVIDQFQSLLIINKIHSNSEEDMLLT